ncbi:hypothetical protein [Oceanidesulfovibrio indonesiensis]|uniref:hypothetical protein n=1 Tax=Oceanidesulfovibrio indonesiensis TaxID=54767 RepID=UPI001F443745|nr:hypothetical protein [Oceanidesulfovibrio indonesiensis]
MHDSVMDQVMINGFAAEFTIADKAYDADEIVAIVLNQDSVPVIPSRSNRPSGSTTMHLYKERHLSSFFLQNQRVQTHRNAI